MSDAIKVALYARVSDDKKKGDGERRQDVNRQLEILRDFVRRKGITDWTEYVDDGKSAFTDDWHQRPAFSQMFNDCRRHFVREIYIEDMSRFARRLDMGLQWLKELGELQVQLVSLREGELEVTSARGWMQSSMCVMFAEWDSRIKAEKVRSGMQKAKNLGKQVGGFRGGVANLPLPPRP